PDSSDRLGQLLARAVLSAPTFTLRGGTTEVLRSLIARSVSRARDRAPADLLTRTVDDILTTHGRGGSAAHDLPGMDDGAWRALSGAGLPLVGVPEDRGGSGGTATDAATILLRAGGSGVAAPLAETGLLAGWALSQAAASVPAGPLTIALDHDLVLHGDTLSGTARRVPFAADAVVVVAVVGERLVAARPTRTVPGKALNGEPRDTVVFDDVRPAISVAAPCTPADLRDRAAATRVLLIAGALRTVLRLAVQHTSTREQFGTPILKFQAVEHQIALLAEQVARAEMAAELAVRWLAAGADREDLAVATLTAREAATLAAKLAHQVHGAIGIAAEYDLQVHTRSLWTWRDECGSEREWAAALGASAVSASAGGLWNWLSR
ncbi:MAG TPA: acyl-CoA dehydrogenase family protein, partial [Sporichthya sp.]|nr:acyl-CoA dehydrogenase family protein [Sporichthya sp.]